MRRRLLAAALCCALPRAQAAVPLLALVQQLVSRQALGGAAIYGAGDVLAATVVEPLAAAASGGAAPSLDVTRHVHAMGIGYVWGGSVLPWVYQLAESLFPGRTPRNCLLKVAVSCGILSTFGNYFNLLCRRLLSGVELPLALANVNDEIAQVVRHDLKVWPLYDLVCFGIIPPAARPTATAMMSTCWATYLSFLAAAQPAPTR